MNTTETKGHLKVIICKNPEDRRPAIQKAILEQTGSGLEPAMALLDEKVGDTQWTRDLMIAAGISKDNPDTAMVERLSRLPLYVSAEECFDIGWITWRLLRTIEDHNIRRIYIEDISLFDIVDPNTEKEIEGLMQEMTGDDENIKVINRSLEKTFNLKAGPMTREDAEESVRDRHVGMAIEILRHVIDAYGIELTIALDNKLPYMSPQLRDPINSAAPYGFGNLVDEFIYTEYPN